MTTVPRGSEQHQSGTGNGPEKFLIGALVLIFVVAQATMVYTLKLADDPSSVAPVVVPASSAISLAAISAIAVVLRKRPGRSRRS
ncbi:hypothetical protein [Micromonospora inositola]|uniref:Uncharacterized protein n=1 Tax=Micromonospora inositola TaxID=47865 RepID=A0A1C5IPK3_9ACTN|nr:hypothetical protein [Micromonospora inositola]SCG60268.1 hypothetical protein GA0070613_3220 [Micromonospora inositola]